MVLLFACTQACAPCYHHSVQSHRVAEQITSSQSALLLIITSASSGGPPASSCFGGGSATVLSRHHVMLNEKAIADPFCGLAVRQAALLSKLAPQRTAWL